MKGSLFGQILGGLAIGLALGLLITWVIAPVEYTDTSPASMREEFKINTGWPSPLPTTPPEISNAPGQDCRWSEIRMY